MSKKNVPRAGGEAEPVAPAKPRKPASEDPFKIYSRNGGRAHYEKMKEEGR